MQINRDKKIMELNKQVKIINVVEQNKEELVILLIKLYNGENTMQVLQMIEVKHKNILLNKQRKMLEYQRKV
jgi:hypothetical protein